MKKIISILLSILTILYIIYPFNIFANAETYSDKLKKDGFPVSYISQLVTLHNKYPNWKFISFNTNLKWSDAVNGERAAHSNQIIETYNRNNNYFCTCDLCKDKIPYSGCKVASNWAVQYYMDPRNFLDETHIFQFESNSYSASQNQSGVEQILSGTWMKNANISYTNTDGKNVTYKNSENNPVKYSSVIIEAGKDSGLSPYYLASRIVKEVGNATPTASGVCGTKQPFRGIYNYYNIGAAYGGTSGLEWASGFLKSNKDVVLYSEYDTTNKKPKGTKTSIKSGQTMTYIGSYGNYYKVKLYNGDRNSFTSDGLIGYIDKSSLRTTYFNYNRPWTSPYKSIIGGAKFISTNYEYQFTNYLQKFNVNKESPSLYSHEYMQNIDAPEKESEYTYKAYSNAGILSSEKVFYIPVFNNMPENTKNINDINDIDDFGKVLNIKLVKATTNSIKISWDKQNSSHGYRVYSYNPSTKKLTLLSKINSNNINYFTISSLKPGTVYYCAIKSFKGDVFGKRSNVIKVVTKPKKVNLTKVTSPGKGKIKTVWTPIKNVSGYQIKYSRNKSFTKVVANKTLSSKYGSYVGKNFTKGVTYYIKVRSYKKIDGKKYYGPWSKIKIIKSK